MPLAAKIWDDVGEKTELELIERIDDHLAADKKVSRIWGETKGKATDGDCVLVLARKCARLPDWSNEIDWDEPYRDGGPDAAHVRLKRINESASRNTPSFFSGPSSVRNAQSMTRSRNWSRRS